MNAAMQVNSNTLSRRLAFIAFSPTGGSREYHKKELVFWFQGIGPQLKFSAIAPGSGRRPGEARTGSAREPPSIALQAGGPVEAQHDDDVVGQHRCFDLAP